MWVLNVHLHIKLSRYTEYLNHINELKSVKLHSILLKLFYLKNWKIYYDTVSIFS